MILKEKTYEAYSGLAKYCRTGNEKFTKGIELRKDRIHHYRRLVFNITNNTLKQAYPIALKLLSEEQWKIVVNDYFENHDAQEYRIWLMPKEFYEFVVKENYAQKFKINLLNDLLLFEWIEIELHTMEDENIPKYVEKGDLWKDVLVLNPEYRLLQFEYPVHFKKTKTITEEDKANYFLFAYREFDNKGVKFINLSVLFAFIIEQIEEKQNLKNIIDTFCKLTQSESTTIMKAEIEQFIQNLINKNVILGFI